MSASIYHLPRAKKPGLSRLGLYLRIGRNQHRDMESALLLADGIFGLVIDPTCEDRHSDLMTLANERQVDVILDPRSQELALEGGWSETLGSLAWGNEGGPHRLSDFNDMGRRRFVRSLAQHVVSKGYTGVLSPSHYVTSLDSGWLEVDVLSCSELRSELNRLGAHDVQILYSLAVPYKLLRSSEARHGLVNAVAQSGADAIWLKVSGLGSDSTATAVRNYVAATIDFHVMGIPVIADHIGGLAGKSLLAFGAVGGLAHGVTLKERFDVNPWVKERKGEPFQAQSRIYVEQLGLCLDKRAANVFFANTRATSRFGCLDFKCCPRGTRDTTENPVRHAVRRRSEEVRQLSEIPVSLRPNEFLDKVVKVASEHAIFASQLNFEDSELAKRLQKLRKLRNDQRDGLTEMAKRFDPEKVSEIPRRLADRI